jgi:hypothetical protein
MDLDHLTLSPYQVSLLYKKNLVVTGEAPVREAGGGRAAVVREPDVQEAVVHGQGAQAPVTAFPAKEPLAKEPLVKEPLKYLGENKRHILLLVKDPGAVYLEEQAFNFLLSILNACGLSMEAVALVNTDKTGDRSPGNIADELDSRFVLLFGIDPGATGLPAGLPAYQVTVFGERTYLCADELASIERERTQKGRLWACLKQLFQL